VGVVIGAGLDIRDFLPSVRKRLFPVARKIRPCGDCRPRALNSSSIVCDLDVANRNRIPQSESSSFLGIRLIE
jgi:hypothetical protein